MDITGGPDEPSGASVISKPAFIYDPAWISFATASDVLLLLRACVPPITNSGSVIKADSSDAKSETGYQNLNDELNHLAGNGLSVPIFFCFPAFLFDDFASSFPSQEI